MYLNFNSERPMNLKRSIPYSQFLRLKIIHSESHYLIQSQIHLYWYFIWQEYPHDVLLEAWNKTNQVTRESLLTDSTGKNESKAPLYLSQHITVLIPTSGKSYLNIGPIWVGQVPPENYATKILWSCTGSHPPWKTCWWGLKSHNQKQESARAAQDPTLVNIVQDYPNHGK